MDTVLSSATPSATDVNSFLSAAEKEALKAATFQRLHPQIYLERFLEEKIRPDGRSIADDENEDTHAWRNVEVNVGSITTTSGSALVRLGNTTVVCGVKAEICEPELDNSDEGFLVPNVDLPALCSPKFKTGPPTEEAQVLSERLNEVLGNGMIPLSSLCIYPGKSAWVLYVDATVINYDGNVFDAALLAMVCALKNVSLPHAEFNPELNRTICTRPKSDSSKPARKLIIEEDLVPLSFSFGVFAGSYLLPDPTASEESLLDTTISIILNTRARILALSQLGTGVDKSEAPGQGVADISHTREADTLARCISLAKKRQAVIMKKVYDT
ncbi:ribosomal protein S5 domain 2-type protein [Lentinula edodes]|uniref:Ribosomal RNA-processing protein 43 n=1 Tax=Lentinula edodes TaxID=5353 RepID=A0A1Q3EI89_LENED|nr:ribosomal protein S5 domain 2-type protein [Lentinula edodes]GAW06938.1 exosome component 8 [Lentinula edodes]